ncbi:hypothetical protein M409DRAFT_24503 [Zasmidium cellare ATCC 36951]|uniref:PBP domain-containing protein n=1 Tax=Zasmidium cellare ATCC 36951 TaxID=1080233 RepID=A0A6A6CDE7_ZASCE|nr:uncharacterized protein M409DRAFT_24503 [Zasmidium cellare ATCC 36951]KAF2165115.1 hypothetical protein M409DRAFT_24503 [Zasmidium cellare ATCC 36951]
MAQQQHPGAPLSGQVDTSDPWISRNYRSKLLSLSNGPSGSDVINTKELEMYGDAAHDVVFRIGNGGAGYTGVLRMLADMYIAENGGGFRIGWVPNHSRHSQIALLAGVVEIALTYEPHNEDLAIDEGWASRVGRAFNDHFILVGPDVDVGAFDICGALRIIAESHSARGGSGAAPGGVRLDRIEFHTRGDGSATFAKEQLLWQAAGVDVSGKDWMKTYPLAPYDALLRADNERAFLLTDRATFLTAKRDGVIPSLHVHVEGGQELLNPCSAVVKSDAFVSEVSGDRDLEAHRAAARFAVWLTSNQAQSAIKDYGRQWGLCKPLFTPGDEEEFSAEDRLPSS